MPKRYRLTEEFYLSAYIQSRLGVYRIKVRGARVKLELPTEDCAIPFDAFLHHSLIINKNNEPVIARTQWAVSDVRTGLLYAHFPQTHKLQQEAIDAAQNYLYTKDYAWFLKVYTKVRGVIYSPAYSEEDD